jgi:hypothetical protein
MGSVSPSLTRPMVAAHVLAGVALAWVAAGRAAATAAGDDSNDASANANAAPTSVKAAVIERLTRLNQTGQFLFGQENATLWGMYLDGGLVSTGTWFEKTARAGRFTSDSEALVGDQPAVLGIPLSMLAFDPPAWNRRAPMAAAIRRQVAAGGVVTMDWHAPSCGADLGAAPETLATVIVNDQPIKLKVSGGALFYAEEDYKRAIKSAADVPETLKCLCRIANDQPMAAGAYQGISGRTWLVANAKHIAAVMRAEGLAALPIIMRPFHEHTGAWFWWGQPYWNCAALLDKPDAISGPDAYKTVVRTFVSTLRSEPGMQNLLFAYSPDKLIKTGEDDERLSVAQHKVVDPVGHARDLLRARLVRELGTAGLAYVSPVRKAIRLRSSQVTSARLGDSYVAERRPLFAEGYAGDDVFDLLGLDLYHPIARPAGEADLRLFRLQLRVLAEEARMRGKPYALTEAGTYRLQLAVLASQVAPRRRLIVNGQAVVDDALARLFDAADRASLLRYFGLARPGPVTLSGTERAVVLPAGDEDWFNDQLLVIAKEAKVAYALVWQTYYDAASTDHYFYYYVPYPGHPAAASFRRFHADPATCFLGDACPP